MDQFEKEDSSTYVRQDAQNEVTPVNETPVAPTSPSKPKRSKLPLVLGALLVLALAVAGVLGWMWNQSTADAKAKTDDLALANKEVSNLRSALKEAEAPAKDTDTEVDASSDENATIIETVLAYEKARLATSSTKLEAKIAKKESPFAAVTVTSSTGSGATVTYLKLSQGQWVIIGDSTDELVTLKEDFGLPEDLLTADR